MNNTRFDGQQNGERILYAVLPHPFRFVWSVILVVSGSLFCLAVIMSISGLTGSFAPAVRLAGTAAVLLVSLLAVAWIRIREDRSVAYITDRRVIRFDPVSPVLTTKRSLFWNEVLKAKAYSPNLLLKLLNIGTLKIEPHLTENENIIISDVSYSEDLANYLDKILYLFKNKPEEISVLRAFVPKPKGRRD